MTPLRPAGKMKIGDDIVDVVTEGEFLEKGMAVVITAIDGNRVVVNEED
jgi:membrane-bound serine protease (ClpP class)